MTKALLFGSVGTLVETSDLQRKAFNKAFVAHGVDWYWDRNTYAALLEQSGGQKRIAEFAADLGETVDAEAVHQSKVEIYGVMLKSGALELRSGVKELIDEAKDHAIPVAFVTSTSKAQSQAIIDALGDKLRDDAFDYIGHDQKVAYPKPAPDIYQDALRTLRIRPSDAIAIEDSPVSAQSAVTAGIPTYAMPGAYHAGSAFPKGVVLLDHLPISLIADQQIAAE